jgi:membrane-associated PAP2 superfamily phosphatase
MLKKLDPLGEEYFYQIIQNTQPMTIKRHKRVTMWGALYFAALLEAFALVGISVSPAAASRMEVIDYVALAIIVSYGLFLLVATIGKFLDKSYVLRMWSQLMGIWCTQLSVWAVFSTLACAQAAADFYFPLLVMFLILAVILNIHMIGVEQNKLVKGYYLKGSGGFFGSHAKLAKRVLGPLEGMSGGWVAVAVVGWGLVYSRTRPDGAGTPLWVLIALPLVPLIFFILFAPITATQLIQIHLYKRFGIEAYTSCTDRVKQKKQKNEKRG